MLYLVEPWPQGGLSSGAASNQLVEGHFDDCARAGLWTPARPRALVHNLSIPFFSAQVGTTTTTVATPSTESATSLSAEEGAVLSAFSVPALRSSRHLQGPGGLPRLFRAASIQSIEWRILEGAQTGLWTSSETSVTMRSAETNQPGSSPIWRTR